jgi:hypothetical protein
LLAHELLNGEVESEIGTERDRAVLEVRKPPVEQGANLTAIPYGLNKLVTNKDGP